MRVSLDIELLFQRLHGPFGQAPGHKDPEHHRFVLLFLFSQLDLGPGLLHDPLRVRHHQERVLTLHGLDLETHHGSFLPVQEPYLH